MNFFAMLSLLAQILPAVHSTIAALAPLFPKAAGGTSHVDAVVQSVTQMVAASGMASGLPDAHIKQVTDALPALVAMVSSIKHAADTFNAQQHQSAPGT